MKLVQLDFTFCYGIPSLQHSFDFVKKRQHVIYAPNGVMKSSFASTFKDLSSGTETVDRIYKERETKRVINDEDGKELAPDSIFVVEPYNETYRSNRMSTLLANRKLRETYDEVRKSIDEKKSTLIKALQSSSGMKKGVEEALAQDIVSDPKEFFQALKRLVSDVDDKLYTSLSDIKYDQIFSAKVAEQITSSEFISKIENYMQVYDRLITKSTFFRKGAFNHNNASDVAKSLKANGFFKAEHSVYVKNRNVRKEVKTEADLEKVIKEEKEDILGDTELIKQFDKIDSILSKNAEMKVFRSYLNSNEKLIPELSNPARLRQRLWIAYLGENKDQFKDLIDTYDKGREQIEEIVEQAKQESTRWAAVLAEFNTRFSVPFIVTMENQQDVILKADAPSVKFRFANTDGEEVPVDEADLVRVLSNGEKRALYLLNVIFEVKARREENVETLFIFDDIADSFDYKNKYAIVEYLRDITETEHFYQLILTHNYDFYRTVSSRLDLERENKLHTLKNEQGVFLRQEKYQNNPFKHWKENLHKGTEADFLLAMIPFVRNIAEFAGNEEVEADLTRYLHVKPGSMSLTVKDLEGSFKKVVAFKKTFSLPNPTKPVLDILFEQADAACLVTDEEIELESKIVLAMAIRVRAELFMIAKIADTQSVEEIKKNQTFELLKRYALKFPTDVENIGVMKQVNLMTPENIHLNSFMYEPILDMSNHHLKRLYNRVKNL